MGTSRRLPVLSSVLVGCACCAAVTVSGCRSVSVAIDSSLRTSSTEVHLVGINSSEYEQWGNIPMAEYWDPGCELRKQAVRQGYARVLKFGPDHPLIQVLDSGNPVWDRVWTERNAEHLFILANLPGKVPEGPGNVDGRRKIHPLKPWPSDGQLKVVIGSGGIVCQNPSAGEKKR